ncbi:MAG: hypothetical protein Q9203_003522 [Teloschistes exilis]
MSIRGRLGRWWDRVKDDGQVGDSRTEAQLSEPSDSSPKPSFSPKTLHKAASTTFQAFSDSLRSKAQAFYAQADHAEQNPPTSPAPSTPRRSSHRSALWSSVRSRGSRSSRRARIPSQLETDTMLTPEQWPATPTRTSHSPIGPAPKLSLDIPNLSLRDVQDDSDDVTISPDALTAPSYSDSKLPILVSTLHSEPKQLWPSPHVHLTGKLPAKAACAAINTPALAADDQDFQSRAKSPTMSTSADTERQNELVAAASPTDSGFREVCEAETLRSTEDTFYTADSGSNTRTSTPTASTARTSISGPPSSTEILSLITSVKSSKDFKGTYFKGMVVPIGKATYSSKRTLTSIGVQSDSQDPSLGEVDDFVDSEIPEPPPTSCANQVTGERAGKPSQAEATHVTAEPLVSSDGIPGETPSYSPIATMGPREVWDQSRADRKQRYDSLQSVSSYSDASTDECSDFGSELEMTPNLFRVPTVQQEANSRGDRSPGTKPIFRRSHKATSPLKFRRKHKFPTREPELPLDRYHVDSATMSEPRHTSNGSEPVQLNIEDYMADKQLRLDLLEAGSDVLLHEPSNAANASTAPDRIFITSALYPNDELDRRRMNPSYWRRAHMTPDELKANPTSDDEDNDSPAATGSEFIDGSNKATAGETSCADLSDEAQTLPDNTSTKSSSGSNYDYIEVESWRTSRDSPRGKRRVSSSMPISGQPIAVGAAESSNYSGQDDPTTSKSTANKSPAPMERSVSPSESSPSVTPDTTLQEQQEREHEKMKKEEEEADATATATAIMHAVGHAGPPPPALRQRLADISMVERRQMLTRRADYERLCQIVYDCEQVSEMVERLAARAEDDDDSVAEESVKEEEDGYSAAIFNGGLEEWVAPIPHALW